MASSEETMVTPQSEEQKLALEDIRAEHGALVPASPVGQPQVLGPPAGHGGSSEVNAFWSEKVKNEAILRAMRPAALPGDDGDGLQHLQEFLGEKQMATSPGSDPGTLLGGNMLMRVMADENAKLKQELQAMRDSMFKYGLGGNGAGNNPQAAQGEAFQHGLHVYHPEHRSGLNSALGSAVGGIKGLLGIKDQASSTLIPMLVGEASTCTTLGTWNAGGAQVEALQHGGAHLPGRAMGCWNNLVLRWLQVKLSLRVGLLPW